MALYPLVASKLPRNPVATPPSGPPKPINIRMIGRKRDIYHKLTIGGLQVAHLMGWSKSEQAYSAGSTATATIPLTKEFDLFSLYQAHLKEHDKPLTFEVTTTMLLDSTETLFKDAPDFSGVITSVKLSKTAGTYTITASSYAQVLQNEKVNEVISGTASKRKTTTEVVKDFATRYGQGLKIVDANGKSTVFESKMTLGTIYKEQAVQQAVNISVWDLFMSFAAKDGADVFVKGDVLYYVKKAADASPDITELVAVEPSYTYDCDTSIKSLDIDHSPLFSHDISVTVKSYQPLTQETVTSTAAMSEAKVKALAVQLETDPDSLKPSYEKSQTKMAAVRKPKAGKTVSSGQLSVGRVGNKENYTFVLPNASQEDCDRIAAQIAEDISRKEFLVTLTVLGQPDFNPRQYIKLVNTGSAASDQVYAIKSLDTRSEYPQAGGESEGYVTTFTLVNHAVQSVGTGLGV